jgi:UDP-glucose 4-epimerase
MNLKQVLQEFNPTLCIHCAARSSVGLSVSEPESDFQSSVAVTFNVLDCLRQFAPDCVLLLLSSAAVYGNPHSLPVTESQVPAPLSPYGFHKWMAEQLCLEFTKIYGLRTASLRIFSAYGPGLRRQVIWDICQKALLHQTLSLQGTGQESRDFIHALDIAHALEALVSRAPLEGETYNLGSGQETKISTLTSLILTTLERNCEVFFDGVVPVGNPLHWCADISKLQGLDFTITVPLEQGVTTFTQWCRAELLGI